ncbi:putative ATP-dependent RNA helicase DHR1 [Cyphellophora attinorum]|uniref:RNA helicase n=1 Tax=Cyphellophora attinorum TaxID=1664694 RepID=A0A0N1P0D4_9EURO|nr:putative ATP-dependent RNA helicase DHR1 [Phialophora attinorum]KPI42530.1 putative ATP-dependent RNA helicase DHR1 [Phialophora attinorum]
MARFTPKPRKQKARREAAEAAQAISSATSQASNDANAAIIVPDSTKSEREEKKRILRDTLRREQAGKPSAKKQKRLDKYIENKLKRDENLEVLRLLEAEKVKEDERRRSEGEVVVRSVPGGVIGKRGREAEAESASKARKRRRTTHEVHTPDEHESSDEDAESEDSFEEDHPEMFEGETDVSRALGNPRSTAQVGSGLAQPLQLGSDGLPILPVKPGRRKAGTLTSTEHVRRRSSDTKEDSEGSDVGEEESDWEGFSDNEPKPQVEEDTKARRLAIIQQIMAQEDSDDDDEDSSAQDSEVEPAEESSMSDTDVSSAGNDDSDTDPTSEHDSADESDTAEHEPSISAFKAWATQQLNQSLGHTPSYEAGNLPTQTMTTDEQNQPIPRPPTINPILGTIPAPTEPARQAYSVHVDRTAEIQASRSELPILQREQEIMEAIYNNPVVIIKGDTGSGKTTQIPQFLYEAGFGARDGPTPGMIGITQPRRVAAVGYQIRFDSKVTSQTAVKFMTDGVLLRELSQDVLLKKYSVIVIDEAHERSINTDLLIGILSKVVPARLKKTKFNPEPTPLKLIIMSATLNLSDFVHDRLFDSQSKPPVVEAEGRQHRVTTHFALRSRADYLDEVVEKVRRAHHKLPRGGMLVFLTGQNEIRQVGERLQKVLRVSSDPFPATQTQISSRDIPQEVEDLEIETIKQLSKSDGYRDDFDEVEFVTGSDEEEEEDEFDISDDEEEPETASRKAHATAKPMASKDPYISVHILPLYSQLPTKEQLRVFDPPPEHARQIILSTNVAETSLTIPGIRYVFDTGRSKERKYNLDTGVQSFEIDWISKASAAQRAGRAGRTGPGHCWRLYTSAVYEQFFADHAEPQILRAPAESIVLQLKSLKYPKAITEFPFPSSPAHETLTKAEKLLRNLGALSFQGKITALDRVSGLQNPILLPHALALVSGLAIQEVFYNEAQLDLVGTTQHEDGKIYLREQQQEDEARDQRKQAFGRARATLSKHDKLSDAMKLLTAVTMYVAAEDKESFCEQYFLRSKAMFEVSQLYRQLLNIVCVKNPALQLLAKPVKLSSKDARSLNHIAAAGYIDQVAIRADLAPQPPEILTKPRRAIDVPYLPLQPLTDRRNAGLPEKAVFIHPSSLLAKQPPKDLPMYVVYSHLQKSQPQAVGSESVPKTRMFPLTPISGDGLAALAKDTALLEYGRVVTNMKIVELRGVPKRRECWVMVELKSGVLDLKSASGWRVEEVLGS